MRQPFTWCWPKLKPQQQLVFEATPPAKTALLIQAVSFPEGAATIPYAGCGRLHDGSSRAISLRVAAGATHARAAVTVFQAGEAIPVTLQSTTGGTSAAETITLNSLDNGTATFGYQSSATPPAGIIMSSTDINDAPGATMDRQLELTTSNAPYNEVVYITDACASSFGVSAQVVDLESL